jgi:hypothetical protein
MLGQFLELPWARAPGVPGRGGAPWWALVEVLAGVLLVAVDDEVAALAIAAPPPAIAAVAASVMRTGFIR